MTEMQPTAPIKWTLTDIILQGVTFHAGSVDTLTKRENKLIEGYVSDSRNLRIAYFDCIVPGRNIAAITVKDHNATSFEDIDAARKLLLESGQNSIQHPEVNLNRRWVFLASANLYLPELEEREAEKLNIQGLEAPNPIIRSCFLYTTEW